MPFSAPTHPVDPAIATAALAALALAGSTLILRRRRALLVILPLLTLAAGYWHVAPPYPEDRDHERFGVGLAGPTHHILNYDLQSLGAAWYLNWGAAADPPHPHGAPFMQTIRLKDGQPRLSDQRVTDLVEANPGATWQIGNEPDSIWLDDTEPEAYAHVYHHLYHIIKAADPTARVANGGLVQATPLRMAYLDRVWDAYQAHYGERMPVDVWIAHGFILREQRGSWGADIPPGMGDQAHLGMRYDLRDHDDLAIFAQHIHRFRQWMADHGQRQKPLIVNEYAILMPTDIRDEDGHKFSDERVIAFMTGTFDYFLTATDPDIGCPDDGHRLVQKWAWYSLDDDRYDPDGRVISRGYNGDLFTGAFTKTMTALGRAYGTYVVGDLTVDSLTCPTLSYAEGEVVTATALLDVRRIGGLTPTASVDVVLQADGTADGGTRAWTIGPLGDGTIATLTATLPYTAPGAHPVTVHIDPSEAVTEVSKQNNHSTCHVLIATDHLFLPVITRPRP